MSVTRLQAIAYAREMMDGASSARWTDTWIKTVLGLVGMREWQTILGANPLYRFGSRSATTDSSGTFLYSGLDSGSGDTKQNWYRILSISDGQTVYKETQFQDVPLGTTTQYALTSAPFWYDAGLSVQVLPVQSSLALTVAVNWMPTRIDLLAADASIIDFPEGHESILWLEAAATLLSKGGMENDAAQTMRAMAQQEREMMFQRIGRRSAGPINLGYSDLAGDWGGF